ncbi:MAG: cell division protein FtsL [Candidatus Bipolaricaulota bacterium]
MLTFRDKLLILGLLLLVTFLIMLYLWQSWQEIHLNREIARVKEEIAPIREKNRDLRIKVSRNFSPARIERIAKEKLDMKEPTVTDEESEDDSGN